MNCTPLETVALFEQIAISVAGVFGFTFIMGVGVYAFWKIITEGRP